MLINKFEIIGFHISLSSTWGSFLQHLSAHKFYVSFLCILNFHLTFFDRKNHLQRDKSTTNHKKVCPSHHVLEKHDKPKVSALGWYQNSWLMRHVCVLYRRGISWCSWILFLRWRFRIWYFGLWRHVFSWVVCECLEERAASIFTSAVRIGLELHSKPFIIIFNNWNWVITRWQWLYYMYTNMERK